MRDLVKITGDMAKGIWVDEEPDIDISDDLCYDKGKSLELKCGYVCPECERNVLTYNQPFECSDHE